MNYEYRCSKCKHVFTRQFRLAENPKFVSCPECGCLLATRYFGAAPTVCFKGSGWGCRTELDAHDPQNDRPLDFTPEIGDFPGG